MVTFPTQPSASQEFRAYRPTRSCCCQEVMFGHEHHQLVVTLLNSAGHAMPELGNSHLSGLLEGPGVADLALHVHALDLHAFFPGCGLGPAG